MTIYKSKRVYCKYQDWEQPVLTANGTLGGDSFAVSSNLSDFYKAFDDNNDSYINGFNENCWFVFYNPNPLKVSAIEMLSTSADYTPRAGTLEYSDDNATWVKVFDWNSNSANPYMMTVDAGRHKYWKVTVVTRGSSIGNADIKSVKITAQESVESTSSDHDYSVVETDKIKDVYKSTERKYYKYGTELDATVVGSPAIVEGVVSGFSSANYLTLPEIFNPQSNTWEQVWSVTTGANTSTTYQEILAQSNVGTAAASGYDLRVDAGKIILWVEATSFTGATVLQDNTKYLIKAQFTGSAYILSYSTDNGASWVEDCNVASTVTGVPDMNVPQYVGVWKSTYHSTPDKAWLGSIDLTQSYININGKEWWHGTKAVETTPEDADYSLVPAKRIVTAYKTGKRKYYKYVFQDWTQPTNMTSAGTMGGDSFAVAQSSVHTSHDFWKLFSDSDLGWHSAAGLPQWVSWYNPNPLKVTNLFFDGTSAGNIGNVIVQACDDNSSWIDIVSFSNTNSTEDFEIDLSSNNEAYKYWRIYITSCYYITGGKYYPLINRGFTITAQEEVAVESTSSDYDYYETPNQLVYDYVKQYLTTADWKAVKSSSSGGNVWGEDSSHYSYYSGSTSDTFTFNTLQPSGKWHLTFRGWQQFNFRHNSFIVTITYEDGTTEQVWNSVSILPNGATADTDYTIPLTMTKKWKTINVYNAGGRVNSVNCYGGVGRFRLLWRGSEQQQGD